MITISRTLYALAVVASTATAASADSTYEGSTFDDVWTEVASDPYAELPHYTVTWSSFFSGFFHNDLLEDSRRTLDSSADLMPAQKKLLHPNGICLQGTWTITEDTPYSGYFAPGSQGLFIGRASTALSETEQGQYRAFGVAGKLFPTMDPNEQVRTANFFTIEDLGGTDTDHFLDAGNTNDIINITIRPSLVFKGLLAATVAQAFMTAEGTLDVTKTLIRQLYPISTIGVTDHSQLQTPRWLMITGSADTERVDAVDFRDELRIENYPDGLAFEIHVASEGTRLGSKEWTQIGRIEITDTAVSASCDRRLHFAHPRYEH